MANSSFFVSYTGADQAWAQWIAWQLEQAGYTTQIQAWDSRPGMNFLAWMNQAAATAERTLVVLSPAYEQAAGFTVPEWTAALHKDPGGTKGLLVPVRVAEFAPAGLLGPLSWIDLVGLDEEQAEAALLAGVRRERLKPATPPQFPGGQTAKPCCSGWTAASCHGYATGGPMLVTAVRSLPGRASAIGSTSRSSPEPMAGGGAAGWRQTSHHRRCRRLRWSHDDGWWSAPSPGLDVSAGSARTTSSFR